MPKKKDPASIQRTRIFIVLICIIIGIFLLFLFSHFLGNSSLNKYSLVLEPLKKTLPSTITTFSSIHPAEESWRTTDNTMSILSGNSFSGLGMLQPENIPPLVKTATEYFITQGFHLDPTNTFSTLQTDNAFQVQSLGFTKGETKCLVTLFVQTDPNAYYFCGTVDTQKNDLQTQFFPVLYGSKTQYPLRTNESAVITVTKITNSFATGSNNRYMNGVYEPSGTTWIAAKTNGQWQLVSDGQDYPMCSTIDNYHVPKDFYHNCYTSTMTPRFN